MEQIASEEQCCENTDRELWREKEGDFYSDSIHVTKEGAIGINCGGHVFVMPLKIWHLLAKTRKIPSYVSGTFEEVKQWH